MFLALLIATVVGTAAITAADGWHPPTGGISTGLSDSYLFGTNSASSIGWLMPANTMVTTSLTANSSLNHIVDAAFNVFPFQLGTKILRLGLYVDGVLSAERSYNFSNLIEPTPATIAQNLSAVQGAQLANFSSSLVAIAVSLELNGSLPAGTVVTVAAIASSPIWVQVTQNSGVTSHEEAATSSLPSVLQLGSPGFDASPYVPCIQVATDRA